MPTRYTYITGVFKYVIDNNRYSTPKYWFQYANPLYRAKVAEVLLDSRRRSRNSGKIEYLLIGRLASLLTGNLWDEKESGILSRRPFARSISCDLQNTRQLKFGA